MTIPRERLGRLATPCLVVDLAAADRNIARMAEFFAHRPVKLRPHFKAHKTSALLRRQVEAGSCSGVTCATAWEGEVLARAGFQDILVANQVIDPAGLDALGRSARDARITVAVDNAAHVEALERVAERFDVAFGILIEVDVGMGRCGLNFGSPDLLALAARIREAGRLELLGLQGYEGHAVLQQDRELRRTMVWQAAEILRLERERLEQAGFPCPIVSGGGTGTYDLAAEMGVWTEIQAGSYALMDARYATLGLPFENALYCCATVISRRAEDAAVLNVGLKGLTVEYGMPKAADGGFSVIALADEHARLSLPPGAEMKVGDPVLLLPAHIDPAINLHDVMAVWEGGDRITHWEVDGRRRPTTLLAEEG